MKAQVAYAKTAPLPYVCASRKASKNITSLNILLWFQVLASGYISSDIGS